MTPELIPILQNQDKSKKDIPAALVDLVSQSERLYKGLLLLSENEDPAALLGGVIELPAERESVTLRSGGRTFFLDMGKTKNERGYLKITETHIEGEEKKSVRNSVIVFEDQLPDFYIALSRLLVNLKKQ